MICEDEELSGLDRALAQGSGSVSCLPLCLFGPLSWDSEGFAASRLRRPPAYFSDWVESGQRCCWPLKADPLGGRSSWGHFRTALSGTC